MDAAKLRAWWWRRQGLDGSLAGRPPAKVLARSGWARSVGGAGPYLTLFARAGTSRADADAAVAALAIHELPAARGCTYVLPREDFALALAVGDGWREPELRTAEKLGVTRAEVDALCDAVLAALGPAALEPDAIRAAVGDRARSLGDAGKKKGMSTTLPLALGQLQARGEIRRVPINGRLDQQRYAYARWADGPHADARPDAQEAQRELARRFFRWVGPATMGEWQFFSGLGVKAARDAVATLDLRPAEPGGDRLLLPEDEAAWRDFAPAADGPSYALVSGLDAITATRREVASLVDAADRDRPVLVDDGKARPLGGMSDLPSHAILDRGRLVGLWEFDADAGTVAWATFDGRRDDALEAAVARTERWVRDELGDARSFSLDSPKSRAPRVRALRAMRA